jgi:hypothetical protein
MSIGSDAAPARSPHSAMWPIFHAHSCVGAGSAAPRPPNHLSQRVRGLGVVVGCAPRTRLDSAASTASVSRPRTASNSRARIQVPGQHAPRDLSEVDAEIPDARSVRHYEIGGDPYQELVQREPPRAKHHDLAPGQTGQAAQLLGGGEARRDVFRPE